MPLFAECLAYAIGPSIRERGLDGGLCAIADGLLEELSQRMQQPWRRRALLAGAECVNVIAQIIRVRFPATSIWDLPIAAHEFGHVVGQVMQTDGAIAGLIGGADRSMWPWIHEHFADIFATSSPSAQPSLAQAS